MNEEQIKSMKVVELKAELSKLGLSTSGRKEELISRLSAAVAAEKPATTAERKAVDTSAIGAKRKSALTLSTKEASANDELAKRTARGGRFNTGSSEADRRLLRIQRFGHVAADKLPDDLERLRERQERFKTITSTKLLKTDMEIQKIKRLERFGLMK